MTPEAALDQREVDPSNVWGRFQWFAYMDPEANEARAVSCSLALYVVRPTLQEATNELGVLMSDYITAKWDPDTSQQDLHRSLPSEAWEAHTNRFCEILALASKDRGSKWDCGSVVVTNNGKVTSVEKQL